MHDAHVFASGFAHAAVVVSIDLPHWLAAGTTCKGWGCLAINPAYMYIYYNNVVEF